MKKQKQSKQECVKVKQFRYTPAQKKNSSHQNTDHIPIRTLVEKMSSAAQFTSEFENRSKSQMMQKTSVDMRYKNFITPRDTTYKAKPFLFDKFNYENYQNYEYKNPYKPSKMGLEDKMMKSNQKVKKKGTEKNLEIIFCEQKMPQFVKKSNEEIKDFYELKQRQSFSNISVKRRTPMTRNQSFSNVKTSAMRDNILQKRSRRSTLSNYLQEFNTLEKLSSYMERQHKLNEKFLFSSFSDPSKTVLVDIVIHRFDFLKKMKKKLRDLIFKVLLNLQQMPAFYKINIHEYLKFTQLFISRDADSNMNTMFILSFLFQDANEVNFEVAKNILDQIGGPASVHSIVEDRLYEILDHHENEGERVFFMIKNDILLQQTFIDLLVGKY